MANITAKMVKELRERTGAGMMDCKNALTETDGDIEKALEVIQKKGLATVAKKAGAIAADGTVHAYIHAGGRVGVLLEVNCQTDFVARGEDFRSFVAEVAMHIAAASPEYVRDADVPADVMARQRDIFVGQVEEEASQTGKSKPAAVVEKIVEGKVTKWLRDHCLVDQEMVTREDKITVQSLSDELSAKTGEKISIRRFVRYELGEGIEKKVSDLAADVAATLAGGG